MKDAVLAFVENNIATRLLLASHLSALGFRVTVVSNPRAFRRHLVAEPVDWLVLDEAALGDARDLLLGIAQHGHGARIVWLGRPPRQRRVPIEAVFATPLRYNEITRFFSRWAPRDAHPPGDSSYGGEAPRDPGTGRNSHCLPGRDETRRSLAGAGWPVAAKGGDTR